MFSWQMLVLTLVGLLLIYFILWTFGGWYKFRRKDFPTTSAFLWMLLLRLAGIVVLCGSIVYVVGATHLINVHDGGGVGCLKYWAAIFFCLGAAFAALLQLSYIIIGDPGRYTWDE
jgi:hypothetical protein